MLLTNLFFLCFDRQFVSKNIEYVVVCQIKCHNFLYLIIKLLPLGRSKCEKHENSDFTNRYSLGQSFGQYRKGR